MKNFYKLLILKIQNHISIIVAIDNNNAIGYQNRLLCYLPSDLKHFKALTTGHTIVMGRKTFESLPNGALPNRRNIVVSNSVFNLQTNDLPENTSLFVKKSIAEALEFAKNDEKIFIIGGESIYSATIDIADTLFITKIDAEFLADKFFPEIDLNIWQEKERFDFQKDKTNRYNFSFITYARKNRK